MVNCNKNCCGLFLDLDGTLANSLDAMYRVYDSFLVHFGFQGNPSEFSKLNGVQLSKGIAFLKQKYQLTPKDSILQSYYETLIPEAYANVQPNPGAKTLLEAATKADIKIAVVTSGTKKQAKLWLELTHLDQHISVIVGGDSVKQGKPHPEPYLKAMRLIRCHVSHSLAVEDSQIGAQATAAAKIKTFILKQKTTEHLTREDWPPVAGFLDRLDDLIDVF